MTKNMILVAAGLALSMACSTQVGIALTHREDVAAQAPILAIAARNLDGEARGQSVVDASAAEAVADFHTAAESFAGEATRDMSQDEIDTRYEQLIRAWVRVKQTFPEKKAAGLLKQSFDHVVDEWERLARATGYAGQKYQRQYEGK